MSDRRGTMQHRRRAWAGVALLLATAFAAGSPAASQVEISTAIPDVSAGASVALAEGKLELSLEDAIEIALQRNLGLIVQRYNDADSQLDLEQSFSLYDLTATAELSTLSESSPSVSSLGGADVSTTDTQTWNFGLSQLIMTGGSLGFAFNNTESDSNSIFATVNPSYRSDVDFTFTQPLLRDFGKRLTRRGIEIARTNLEISRETFAQQVTNSIQQVVNAYWNLVGAKAQLTVAQRSLELAEQLHGQNKVRVEVGTLAPLELVQSEAGIATRQEEIIRARAAVADAEDDVRQLLNLDRDAYWDTEIMTTSEAETDRRDVALEDAIMMALDSRPEVVSKRLAMDNLMLDSEYFENQKLPQLDLTARYGFNGLGGPVTQRDFLTQEILFQAPGGYSDALDQLTNGDFEGWRVALNLTYPIQNRSAEAQFAKAEVAVDRANRGAARPGAPDRHRGAQGSARPRDVGSSRSIRPGSLGASSSARSRPSRSATTTACRRATGCSRSSATWWTPRIGRSLPSPATARPSPSSCGLDRASSTRSLESPSSTSSADGRLGPARP